MHSPLKGTKGLEFRGRLLELRDHLAVTPPGNPQLVGFLRSDPLEISPHYLVFRVYPLMKLFEPVESIPELGAEPFRSLFFGRTH
jgi:hypothetical protein